MDICKLIRFVKNIYLKIFAYQESEKYKEGKFIIERFYLAKNTGVSPENSVGNEEKNPNSSPSGSSQESGISSE